MAIDPVKLRSMRMLVQSVRDESTPTEFVHFCRMTASYLKEIASCIEEFNRVSITKDGLDSAISTTLRRIDGITLDARNDSKPDLSVDELI